LFKSIKFNCLDFQYIYKYLLNETFLIAYNDVFENTIKIDVSIIFQLVHKIKTYKTL